MTVPEREVDQRKEALYLAEPRTLHAAIRGAPERAKALLIVGHNPGLEQLAAAREVAQLEHQLAQSDIESTHAKIESGGASMKDEENTRVVEHQRYTAFLNSSFELDRAQIQLMRQIGQLEGWALGPARR